MEPNSEHAAARRLVTDIILDPAFRRATFAGAVRSGKPCAWVRVAVRPVEIRGERCLQISYFDATKDVTKNFRCSEITPPLNELLDLAFSGIHLWTATEELDIRTTKKGK